MIEVRIPREITEYREKILFGLSLRQLLCSMLAVGLGIGVYLLLIFLGLNKDLVGYIVIVVTAPILAVGFLRKNGMPFEKYAKLYLDYRASEKKRLYKTAYAKNVIKIREKGKKNAKNTEDQRREASFERPDFSEKCRQGKWQDAIAEIKAIGEGRRR